MLQVLELIPPPVETYRLEALISGLRVRERHEIIVVENTLSQHQGYSAPRLDRSIERRKGPAVGESISVRVIYIVIFAC